jgi:hypothetical protein
LTAADDEEIDIEQIISITAAGSGNQTYLVVDEKQHRVSSS